MKPEIILWAGIFTGPLAWFLNLEANFALAPLACGGHTKLPLYLVSGLTALLSLAAGSMAFQQWLAPEPKVPREQAPALAIRRRMALAGVSISGFALLVILAQVIPNVLLGGCE